MSLHTSLEATARNELAKFFIIASESDNSSKIHMPSCIVDSYWHNLLTKKNQYKDFCNKYVGSDVGHISGKGYEEIVWVKKYEKRYGKLPSIWFLQPDGIFNQEGYENYQKNDVMIASWDCTPVIMDKIKEINKDIENLKKVREINEIVEKINNIPTIDDLDRIDEDDIVKTIKEKVDKFKINQIKKKHKK